MTHPHSAPTRSLPDRPSLGQLRKQAKELLRSYQAGESDAIAEVERFETSPDPQFFALTDAQRVLARAYGFASWTKFKHHVDGVNVDAFLRAARAGDRATARRLAEVKPELVNAAGDETDERLAIHFAVLNRDADMTRLLMELGADARRGCWPDRAATTAFTLASDREYHEIVEILSQGEDRQRRERSTAGATIGSKTDEIAEAILSERCDDAIRILESDLSLIGACSNHGATPLHIAALRHNPRMVTWLLARGAPVDASNPYTDRPISYPASAGLGRTPLDYAAIVAGWAASDEYFGWTASNERFPYLENSRVDPTRFYETVKLLRAGGAVLTPRAAVAIGDQQSVRKMHRAGRLHNEIHLVRGGLLAVAVRVNRIDMVSLLLDLGLDPDEPARLDEDGTESRGFPLWFAALCGRREIAELLVTRGADVNALVFASGDPLCNAYATRDEEMQALLLTHGARLTVENLEGDAQETVRAILNGELAAQSLNAVDPTHAELIEHMLRATAGGDSEIVRMCLPHVERKVDDPWWAGLLQTASLDSLRLILDNGVGPDVAEVGKPTALHRIATDVANGHVPDEQQVKHATMLLDAGASLTRRDSLLQSTPLGWACRWGHLELVKLYLKRGADPVEADAESWAKPLAWAIKREHHEIVELLGAHLAR
ncbi:MAG: hypothetical protein H8E66_30525 [Planctomycetes bacterium]|nr:hypothetical protein [Planctomycetota bacterium]